MEFSVSFSATVIQWPRSSGWMMLGKNPTFWRQSSHLFLLLFNETLGDRDVQDILSKRHLRSTRKFTNVSNFHASIYRFQRRYLNTMSVFKRVIALRPRIWWRKFDLSEDVASYFLLIGICPANIGFQLIRSHIHSRIHNIVLVVVVCRTRRKTSKWGGTLTYLLGWQIPFLK